MTLVYMLLFFGVQNLKKSVMFLPVLDMHFIRCAGGGGGGASIPHLKVTISYRIIDQSYRLFPQLKSVIRFLQPHLLFSGGHSTLTFDMYKKKER